MMTVEVTLLLLVLSISSKDILLFRRWKSPDKQLFISFTNFLFKESSCSYLGAQVEGLLTSFSSLLTREHQQFKEELLASFSSPVSLNWCRILVFWFFLSLNAERWITGHHMVMSSFFWEFECSLRGTRVGIQTAKASVYGAAWSLSWLFSQWKQMGGADGRLGCGKQHHNH